MYSPQPTIYATFWPVTAFNARPHHGRVPVKVLFFSPHALTDSSSGAAQSVNSLLAELTALGHTCAAVTGSVVDQTNQLMDKARAVEPFDTFEVVGTGVTTPARRIELHGVTHYMLFFASHRAPEVLAVEEAALSVLRPRPLLRRQPQPPGVSPSSATA